MEVVAAIVIALVISLTFFYALNARGPWGSLWSFFLLMLLIVWAASLWIAPVGPIYWGVSWAPLIFIGIIFAVLLASVPTSPRYRKRKGDVSDARFRPDPAAGEEETTAGVLGFMFWILIALLLIGILVGYAAAPIVLSS